MAKSSKPATGVKTDKRLVHGKNLKTAMAPGKLLAGLAPSPKRPLKSVKLKFK